MKVKVYVTLKDGIHDPQGEAVLQALSGLGFDTLQQVRMGKYFELNCSEMSVETMDPVVRQMCEQLLANTVVEKYWYEIDAR